LQRAIRATGAERVIVTHGYEAVMVRWLEQQGLDAGSFATEYGQDDDEDPGPRVEAASAPRADGLPRSPGDATFEKLADTSPDPL
jgi:putative mRNA 3-end processing factor